MKDNWRDSISPKRVGAGYFLQQTSLLKFCPREYARFRNGTRKQQEQIITEWASWMRDFKSSPFKILRDAAEDAPMLSRDIVKETRVEVLDSKRRQHQSDQDDPVLKSQRGELMLGAP